MISAMALRLKAALALILAIAVVGFATPADAQRFDTDDIEIGEFYDELEDYGQWIRHRDFGFVWQPDVDDDWRPYTRGRWINTEDYGWYWDSEEPFGWAVYHYGRWGWDDDLGWFWVPGRKWGPAWVEWRHDDDNIGWLPLPPEADWDDERGVRVRAKYWEDERYAPLWIFTSPRYFASDSIYRHVYSPRDNWRYVRASRRYDGGYYRWRDRRVYNSGVRVDFFDRFGVDVRPRRTEWTRDRGRRGYDRRNDNVRIYRPERRRDFDRTRNEPRRFIPMEQTYEAAKRRQELRGDRPRDGARDRDREQTFDAARRRQEERGDRPRVPDGYTRDMPRGQTFDDAKQRQDMRRRMDEDAARRAQEQRGERPRGGTTGPNRDRDQSLDAGKRRQEQQDRAQTFEAAKRRQELQRQQQDQEAARRRQQQQQQFQPRAQQPQQRQQPPNNAQTFEAAKQRQQERAQQQQQQPQTGKAPLSNAQTYEAARQRQLQRQQQQ
ncbi:MAG: DUF6600 domain-containing protein [Hyphomicrobiaceae bacterium]